MREENNKEYVAFFDLDHTILNNNSGTLIARQAYRENLLSSKDLFHGFILSLLYKIHIMKPEKIMVKMANWLKGLPETKIEDLILRVYNENIKHGIRREARNAIESHKKNNAQTVLLSAAMTYVCGPVKDFLDMHDMICTEMEIVDGHFTGLSRGRYCYGEEKLIRARRYCAKHDFSIDQACYYADSISDLHLLEAVGSPVCITPDAKLTRIAAKRGWPVEQW